MPSPNANAGAQRGVAPRPTFRNWKAAARHLLQSGASAAIVGTTVLICRRLPQVNVTTAALILVLVILGIAMRWGWAEAMVAAVTGALGLDYFFWPPYGLGIDDPEHWVAYVTFLAAALTTGQLSARANRHRAEAVQRREDVEKLYRLADAILEGDNRGAIFQRLAGALREILGLEAVATYDKATGCVCRSGVRAGQMTDDQLRDVAVRGNAFSNAASGVSIVPVREGGELAGSIGVAGVGVSPRLLKAIAEKVGRSLSKARAVESLREAEISRRADGLKSAIYDALAHEVRGLLSSINIAATTLLSERPGNAAQQRELLSIIREEVDRTNRWIDEALRTSRADTRHFTLNKAPRDVRDLVAGALEPLRPLLRDRRVGVQIEEPLPPADCDAEMTQRVLKLLLDNALKYSPPDTPITVSSTLDNGRIVFSVSDTGPGVPEDEQARVFEKYYRGSHHRSGVPGTGLGLASAKYLVECQRGEIWVTNRPEGGAAFHFSLPAADGVTA